tara:strand:+ start:335 stop:574 length:240 start_codon:yes stop_codon:yes gene_type:complete
MFILIPLLLSVVVFQEPALDQVGGHGQSSYEYVGCHVVDENPKDGNVAFGPLGVKTPVIFFKQVSDDGTVGSITTAKPC